MSNVKNYSASLIKTLKALFICLFLILATVEITSADQYMKIETLKNGEYVYIVNNSEKEVYCYIKTDSYFVDFYLRPNKKSRKYPASQNITWSCR